MRKQRRCSNYPPLPAIWTHSAIEEVGRQRRRRKRRTPEKISTPTPPLLTYLVGNSHLPLGRLPPPTRRRTKTTNEVPGAAEDGDRVATPTPLPRVSISFPRRKGRTCLKLSAITAIGKDITPTSILEIRRSSQKTSVGLGGLYAGD